MLAKPHVFGIEAKGTDGYGHVTKKIKLLGIYAM